MKQKAKVFIGLHVVSAINVTFYLMLLAVCIINLLFMYVHIFTYDSTSIIQDGYLPLTNYIQHFSNLNDFFSVL